MFQQNTIRGLRRMLVAMLLFVAITAKASGDHPRGAIDQPTKTAGLDDKAADMIFVSKSLKLPFFVLETKSVQGPVLELMAGTGRLSLPLIEARVKLTCVDSSNAMLEVLSRKLKQRGLHADIICADVCRLALPARFELAILPFQAFMEIIGEENQRAALAAVFRCLAPGGGFICTLHNPAIRRKQVDGLLRLVGQFPTEGGTLVVSGFEQGGNPVVSRQQFFEFFDGEGRLLEKRLLQMKFAFVEKDEFEQMAQSVGFRVAQLYGNYDRTPFDPAQSPVMIWRLEKN
ncbi:class I SAM-dependent methyltransferase [candidate division KSB1 bacterium]|nr:class I SAM-dependent methyltransferase [candidate division KSB1 bacterium]